MEVNKVTTDDHSERLEWRVIAPLSLAVLIIFMHASAFGPLAVEVADDLGTSVALVAQMTTIAFSTMAIAGLFVGPIADHFGQRRTMLTGLGVLTGSAFVLAAAPTYPVFLLGGFLSGFGASMCMGTATGLAAARYSGDNQRIALSRIQAAGTSGSILGAPILSTIAAILIWRGAYVVVAAVYVTAIFLIARSLAPDLRATGGAMSIKVVMSAYRPLFSDRSMLALFSSSLLRSISWVGPFVYLGAFYMGGYDLSLRQVGLAYMIDAGGRFTGNLIVGGRLGRRDLRPLYGVATVLVGAGWFAVYVLPLSLPASIVVVAIIAALGGVGWTSLQTILASETPAGKGTTMTLNMSIFAFGSAIGTAIGGVVVGLAGYPALGLCFPAFAIFAAALPLVPSLSKRPRDAAFAEERTA